MSHREIGNGLLIIGFIILLHKVLALIVLCFIFGMIKTG